MLHANWLLWFKSIILNGVILFWRGHLAVSGDTSDCCNRTGERTVLLATSGGMLVNILQSIGHNREFFNPKCQQCLGWETLIYEKITKSEGRDVGFDQLSSIWSLLWPKDCLSNSLKVSRALPNTTYHLAMNLVTG